MMHARLQPIQRYFASNQLWGSVPEYLTYALDLTASVRSCRQPNNRQMATCSLHDVARSHEAVSGRETTAGMWRAPLAALLRLPTVRVRIRGFFTALPRPTPDGPASALTLASSSSTSMPIATSA